MTAPKTIFDNCVPRADVKSGTTKDEHFAADLSKVVNGVAPPEYADPRVFYAHTYPTRGMKSLLKAVCKRLSGKGGEVASVIRLHTQYGGGKTHGLIALVHAVRGMKGVENVKEFIDPALLPKGPVRLAALDGENADPASGLTLERGLRARSLWGEMAYRLAGREGYERLREADQKHVAPGATTIAELFGGEPTLIVLDEISVYLRKVELAFPGASDQFTAFIHALIKAVTSSPNVALVVTLAIGKAQDSQDAYKEEQQRALQTFAEAESVVARSATQLNPTEEDETTDVLRRRLFESVDLKAAESVAAAYGELWKNNRGSLTDQAPSPQTKDAFAHCYPFHPELMDLLTEKTSTLSTFQRTRGMLRLLARTIHVLWKEQGKEQIKDPFAIHPHHVALGHGPIRDEITVRLSQDDYTPALKADVEAVHGDAPALAQQIDLKDHAGRLPITLYVARTIFLHTLAYGEELKGVKPDRLRFSICSPALEPSFIEQARVRFVEESLYLDDRPGAPMRFMVEPNLTQMVRRQMQDIDAADVRNELNERIRRLFSAPGGAFNMVPFPGGPYEVPDEIGDGRPFLVILAYDGVAIAGDPQAVPAEIEHIFQYKGAEQRLREFPNNLVFVVADERLRENMKTLVRRRLALNELLKPDNVRQLADYQERKIKEEYEQSRLRVAEAILHCYRHLFYPSHIPLAGAAQPLGHTSIEVLNASDSPGDGQRHIVRILREQKKVLGDGDAPDAPGFVRDQTPMKTKGELSTLALRNEFRRAPKLSILLSDNPLIQCIRDGIDSGIFLYREGTQVWGKGDPAPSIQVSENAFVHTLADAKHKKLWPRAEKLQVNLNASPEQIKKGEKATLALTIRGGLAPYSFASSEKHFSIAETGQAYSTCTVRPDESQTYRVEVKDSRGETRDATALVLVVGEGDIINPPRPPEPPIPPPRPPKPPTELHAEGPLAQALGELWDKARKAKVKAVGRLIIRFFEAPAAWKVQQAMATIKDVESSCALQAEIRAEGIEALSVSYEGRLDKASAVKSFIDSQIRSAEEVDFTSTYTQVFASGLPLDGDKPEELAKALTRYGAGEAYVEAHANTEDQPAP